MNLRFLFREMWGSRGQAAVFMLCTALSITMLVAVSSFNRDVKRSVVGDGQALHGGDIIVRSNYPLSISLLKIAERIQPDSSKRVRTWKFYSVVRGANDSTQFANIVAVESGYPLYGNVELLSGAPLREKLRPGLTVVESSLLQRMGLQLGDLLYVGNHQVRIADIVVAESSRPMQLINLGPRLFLSDRDLEKTGLVKTGSRVRHGLLLRLENVSSLDEKAAELRDAVNEGRERVETYQTANSRLKRFFDNLMFFLSLISVFTLLLAGAGMQSSISALLGQREKSLAIVRTLGGSSWFLLRHYLVLVLAYGFAGSLLGVGFGIILKFSLPALSGGLLENEVLSGLNFADVVSGLFLGLLVTLFFTFLPLYRLRAVKPNAIFRRTEGKRARDLAYYLVTVSGFILLVIFVIRQLEDVRFGLYFTTGLGLLILLVALATRFCIQLLNRIKAVPLTLRLALRSIMRPGNRSVAVVVTLASAMAVLLTIFLIRHNLQATFVNSFPQDAPNVFLVDIQSAQREGVKELVGKQLELHPIVRARLKAINGDSVNGQGRKRFGDSLTREFNLTYRDELLADEVLDKGKKLFGELPPGSNHVPVSVLDYVADMGDMKIGDLLRFNIQGVEITGEITSIRSRTRSKLYPFFYFVFPVDVLEKAPQTYFGALHVQEGDIDTLQTQVVKEFPNVSLISMARAAAEIGAVMEKLARIINFLAIFSMSAGGLILMSSIVATRFARMREAVYYKILGGDSRFVLSVFLTENMILGLVSSAFGVCLAQLAGWAVCTHYFDIAFTSYWRSSLVLAAVTVIVICIIGTLGSFKVVYQKPAPFLREQSVE